MLPQGDVNIILAGSSLALEYRPHLIFETGGELFFHPARPTPAAEVAHLAALRAFHGS